MQLTNRRAVLSLSLALAANAGLWGQSLTGQISGSIRDPSGSAVLGADLTLKNMDTSLARQAKSDETVDCGKCRGGENAGRPDSAAQVKELAGMLRAGWRAALPL